VPPLLAQLGAQLGGQPAAKEAVQWTPLWDGKTMAGWKPSGFGGEGEVSIEDGKLILDAGIDLTGVNFTGEVPRMNYEVALEAMRVEGGDFFCGLTFPVGEKFCTFIVGGWGGGLVGISSINDQDASENETTQFKKFENGRWYRLRVRVTPEKLQTWIDDEPMADVDLDGKEIDMRHGEIEGSKPFGIATFRTRGALRDIRLRKL
jgi:hypothetical protein